MPADPENTVISEPVEGSDVPVRLMYIETRDGLYQPIGLRVPPGAGPHPIVLLASGNGGGGMARLRDFVHNRGYIMERLLEAGYASAWLRYRAEVELGYNNGGKLVEDVRQRRQLFNRSPLDYEDEISVIEHFRSDPAFGPVGLMGVSHGGEMILKIASEYGGAAAGVACEPAAHEYLDLSPDNTVFVNEETQLRNLDGM
ncbi:MAG: hypothetical protein V3V56_05345 [bacterium]